jgi:hypothetical protein
MKITLKHMCFIVLLVLFLVLAACSPQVTPEVSTATAQIQDNQMTAATVDALRTQVASTVVADITSTALANSPTPTETIIPTNTDTPVPVAVLPSPTASSTPIRIILPTLTPTIGPFSCTVTAQSLAFGAHIPVGSEFDGRWTVKNVGTETWAVGTVDYAYVSGQKFQKKGDAFDLGSEVKPDGKIDIIVDMVAPKDPGAYHAQWALNYNGTTLCTLPVDIRVP